MDLPLAAVERQRLKSALRGAALKASNDDAKERRNFALYNVPMEWVKAIREEGIGVSTYAKIAMLEKLRRDGKL